MLSCPFKSAVIAENIKSLLLLDSSSQTSMSACNAGSEASLSDCSDWRSDVISQCAEVVGGFCPKIERRTRLAASLIMQYTSFSWSQIVMLFW